MRILMLTQFYLPVIGGEERFVHDFSVALAQRGHDVAVATQWQPGQPEFDVIDGVRVYRIRGSMQRLEFLFSEPGRRHVPPIPDPELVAGLRRVIAEEKPAIVHAHNWLLHSFLPLKAWSGARLVVTLHDYSMACATKRFMYQGEPCSGPGPRKCLSCAAAHYGPAKGLVTVLGNWTMSAAERVLVDMFLPESRAVAAGNGLVGSKLPWQVMPVFAADDIGEPREGFDSYLAELPPEYLLFVGDLSRDKGLLVLLEAYRRLADAPPLVLIGRSVPETPIELPPNVIRLGKMPHAAVMEAWRGSTLALIPSVWPEPFGLVVLEAMATARPVIASRIGGIADLVVDGETGLLVTPGDVAALGAALQSLLDDGALRERMGQAGKRRVTQFQAHSVVPRYEQVYHELLRSPVTGLPADSVK